MQWVRYLELVPGRIGPSPANEIKYCGVTTVGLDVGCWIPTSVDLAGSL